MALTDLATADVVTASTDSDVHDLLEMMDDHSVGSVVITEGDEPTGIVTDRMIAMAMRDADSIDDLSAEDLMTDDLVTIEADETHFEAFQTMSDEGIRRVPIVEGGQLTGIVTLDDLLMVVAAELSNASDVIEQQTGTH
ncbi:CBS domain-containing protein [Halobacteria archaeon AArc-dxtr1]|nr:CBS domain-containing protein [Halobacteria archaeon AArc-dxtr1]